MKILKSIRYMLPLHYWTGLVAGVIYSIWVRISIYSQEQDYHEQSFPLGWIILALSLFPRVLNVAIVDTLNDWVSYNANWESISRAAYHYIGYILPGSFFVLAGLLLGKKSDVPQLDAIRRLIIIGLLGLLMFGWVCFACMLAWISN